MTMTTLLGVVHPRSSDGSDSSFAQEDPPMAADTDTESTGPDVPLYGVSIGPTEFAFALGMLASIATLLFHKDFGIAAHEQDYAQKALYYLPIALGLIRSFKHWIATHHNTKIAVAQIFNAAATTATVPSVPDVPEIPDVPEVPAVPAPPAPRPAGRTKSTTRKATHV